MVDEPRLALRLIVVYGAIFQLDKIDNPRYCCSMVVNSTAEARRVIKDWMYGVLVERGETVASLAEQLGMSRANLHRTCSGTQAPRITTLIEIADGLGYDLDLRFVKRGDG